MWVVWNEGDKTPWVGPCLPCACRRVSPILREMGMSDLAIVSSSRSGYCERAHAGDAMASSAHVMTRACAIIDCTDIIASMASLTVRNLDESTKRKLKLRAAQHGRSMEQEVREILESAVTRTPKKQGSVAQRIREIFEPLGGVELEPYPREPVRDPEWIKDWKK